MPPAVGDPVPDFTVPLCDGETFRSTALETLATDGAVLVFSGFVFSAIAENWWKRYHRAGWADFDIPVVGVTRDGPYAQNAFIRRMNLPFRLFSDVNGVACDAFDLRTDRQGMANVSTARRAVFVIDENHTIAHEWVADDWISPVPRTDIESVVADL